jgi:hypothetical protein
LDARLTALLCKIITAVKFKEVKTGCNLVEPSKEGYGSKLAVLPVMMMMMMMMIVGSNAWTGDQPVARSLPKEDNTNKIKADRHPYLKWDSNP